VSHGRRPRRSNSETGLAEVRDHEGSFLVAAGGVAVKSFEDGLQAADSWDVTRGHPQC
jgi:hypothetical protein